MLIVDSAIHLWIAADPSPRHRPDRYSAEAALRDMRVAGIDAAVNIPPVWDPESNEYGLEAARRYPDRFATFGWIDFTRPGCREKLEGWRDSGMTGLRVIGAAPSRLSWPDDGTLDWVWAVAEERAIPVSLAGPAVVPHASAIAGAHPRLKITIDHLGMVGLTAEGRLVQTGDILSLADHANVAVKLSGIPDYAGDEFPYRSMHGEVQALLEAYGSRRLFWGTDITRLPCSWEQAVTMFTEHMPWIHPHDLEAIMGRSICAWHGWKIEK